MKLKWWIAGGVLFLSFILSGRAVAQTPPPTTSADRPTPTPLWEIATPDAKACSERGATQSIEARILEDKMRGGIVRWTGLIWD